MSLHARGVTLRAYLMATAHTRARTRTIRLPDFCAAKRAVDLCVTNDNDYETGTTIMQRGNDVGYMLADAASQADLHINLRQNPRLVVRIQLGSRDSHEHSAH